MRKPLFIFEMANNHMGDVEHGIALIRAIRESCQGFDFDFGFKLQYRNLDTFIHPASRAATTSNTSSASRKPGWRRSRCCGWCGR